MIEAILAVAGLLLTIGLSAPVLTAIAEKRTDRKRREKWSTQIHFDEGIIKAREAYAWERWEEVLSVDSEGAAIHRIRATVVNRDNKSIDHFLFPVFCDRKHIRKEELKPWAMGENKEFTARVAEWEEDQSRGRVQVKIKDPIPPAGRRSFEWGYTMPSTFGDGDEYFCFDIAAPQYELKNIIKFSDNWKINYARWSGALAATLEAPIIRNNAIKSLAMFPRIAERLTIEFGLTNLKVMTAHNRHTTAQPHNRGRTTLTI